MAEFKKLLCISTQSSRLSREEFLLERVAWQDLGQIQNFCDYDRVIINLTALSELERPKVFEESEIHKVFAPKSWMHVVRSDGAIIVVGDPALTIRTVNTAEVEKRKRLAEQIEADAKRAGPSLSVSSPDLRPEAAAMDTPSNPLAGLLLVTKDLRPLDYRRVSRENEQAFPQVYKYLDSVSVWNYSLAQWSITQQWQSAFAGSNVCPTPTAFGITSYSTALALCYKFFNGQSPAGLLILLPPMGEGADAEDVFILRNFLRVATSLPEPAWIRELMVPDQNAIEHEMIRKRETLRQIQEQLVDADCNLSHCKRWYRLLYDDGESLEAVVKEGFELLGASVTKTSKEKDDYRLRVKGFPEGVMEVKGTHNPKFNKGALRQLAGWMDEVIAQDGIVVKGIFVGNSARNDAPQTRGKLFEKNNEGFAVIREIVILRAMDLFCLTILNRLELLDVPGLWKEFFTCKGSFEGAKYWAALPQEFQLPKATPDLAG